MKVSAQHKAHKTTPKRKEIIDVGIIGGAGYTGGELIRLLVHHPYARLSAIHSRSNAGNKVASVHQDLLGETDLGLRPITSSLPTAASMCCFFASGMAKQKSSSKKTTFTKL
jgi:N-acetyl-gamma-glutamyl-phosphate reductase